MGTTEILQNLKVRAAGAEGIAFQDGALCLGSGTTKELALEQGAAEWLKISAAGAVSMAAKPDQDVHIMAVGTGKVRIDGLELPPHDVLQDTEWVPHDGSAVSVAITAPVEGSLQLFAAGSGPGTAASNAFAVFMAAKKEGANGVVNKLVSVAGAGTEEIVLTWTSSGSLSLAFGQDVSAAYPGSTTSATTVAIVGWFNPREP